MDSQTIQTLLAFLPEQLRNQASPLIIMHSLDRPLVLASQIVINDQILLMNTKKRLLYEALSAIRVLESDKICQLQGIDPFATYCQHNQVDLKSVCKSLLLQHIDYGKKIVKYRTQRDINAMIEETKLFLLSNMSNGDIRIVSSQQNYKNADFSEPPPLLKQLYQSTVSFQSIIISLSSFPVNCSPVISCALAKTKMHNLMTRYPSPIQGIKESIVQAFIIESLLYYTKKTMRRIQQDHRSTVNNYLIAFHQRRKHEIHQNTSKIGQYLNILPKVRELITLSKRQIIKKYLSAIGPTNRYPELKNKRDISMIRTNIRSFLTRKRVMEREERLYLQEKQEKWEKSRKQYAKITIQVNKMLQNSSYAGHGIQCKIHIIAMSSWSNPDEFNPEKVQHLFSKALSSSKSCIIKISMEQATLRIIKSDSNIYSYGYEHNQSNIPIQFSHSLPQPPTQVQFSDDGRSQFFIHPHSLQIYARGANEYGQLGFLSIDEHQTEWQQVKIKEKVKQVESRGRRTICLTYSNKIYRWGYFNSQINSPTEIKTPTFLMNKSIKSVSCSHLNFYALTHDGEVFDLEKGLLKVIKGDGLAKILLTTGNSLLQITYLISLRVDCYDKVKMKKITKWFQDTYNGVNLGDQEDVLLSSSNENQFSRANSCYSEGGISKYL